jgi:hypothetical protein
VTLYYSDDLVTLHHGDALDVLAAMPAGSVQMVVTSPPYWGLRKYAGDEGRVWGSADCEHEWGDETRLQRSNRNNLTGSLGSGAVRGGGEWYDPPSGSTCLHCGAWRGSYGLEPLHDCLGWARGDRCHVCYVCHTLTFLGAIWRVLRPDGVVFWNLGDSYASSGTAGPQRDASGGVGGGRILGTRGLQPSRVSSDGIAHFVPPGLKPKDLVLIPQRVALAAQASGWWVRSDIIWAKPNPMPESTRDRPTSSYEHILMLTKAAHYHWDQEAVREATLSLDPNQPSYRPNSVEIARDGRKEFSAKHEMSARNYNPAGRNLRDVWTAREPLVRLRPDLSDDDRAFVLAELQRRGL